MQLTFADEKMTAVDDQGNWLGEIACPVLDHERKIVVIERVFVVPAYRGQGLAAKLMQAFVDHAREESWQLEIMCPYAKMWFSLHDEASDVLYQRHHG